MERIQPNRRTQHDGHTLHRDWSLCFFVVLLPTGRCRRDHKNTHIFFHSGEHRTYHSPYWHPGLSQKWRTLLQLLSSITCHDYHERKRQPVTPSPARCLPHKQEANTLHAHKLSTTQENASCFLLTTKAYSHFSPNKQTNKQPALTTCTTINSAQKKKIWITAPPTSNKHLTTISISTLRHCSNNSNTHTINSHHDHHHSVSTMSTCLSCTINSHQSCTT